jgi:hypothetical protein
MTPKIIHEPMLLNMIQLLAMYKKQIELAEQMVKGIRQRIAVVEECVRANFTGDREALKVLAPIVSGGNGLVRGYYDGTYPGQAKTKQIVEQAKRHVEVGP